MMICPVLDNTASVEGRWKDSQHAPWLTPSRMMWYRSKYLFSDADAANWLVSPVLAPPDIISRSPAAFVATAGCDLLAPEALEFVTRLESGGVEVETKVYEGATHSVLVLAGIHEQGKVLVRDACNALRKAWGVEKFDEIKMEKELLLR